MTLNSPLNLKQIFVVDLAGNVEIFAFVSIIFFAFIAGYFKFDNKITLSLFFLYGLILSSFLPDIFLLMILIAGVIIFFSLSKIIK